MAVKRRGNQRPLVTLQHNPYQAAFMAARRLRVCMYGHQWSVLDTPDIHKTGIAVCPHCSSVGGRGFRRFLLRAGRRGGKTRIGALAVVEELTIPNVWWWASAPTYRDLEDFVMPAFFAQVPQAWLDDPRTEWSESEYTLVLPNRAMIQFRSLEDADAGRGPGLDGWWIDEICKLTKEHWEVGRPMLSDRRGILIATTTPRGEDWVHEEFYERAEQEHPGYWACSYRTTDNPIFQNPEGQEEIAEAKATMSELMFRQEYEADIVTFTGAIYGEYVDRCIIDGTDEEMKYYFDEWPNLDATRPSIGGIDPGTDHPFAFTQLVASPRGLVLIGEYEERQKPFAIHVTNMRAVQRGLISRVGIDRSAAQAQIELAQSGFYTVQAEHDVVAGINRVTAWMLKNLAVRPTGALPHGLVLPKRYAPKTIKALQKYRWTDSEKRDGSTKSKELVYKKGDDLPDALRYGLMTYPVLPTADPVLSTGRRDLSTLPDRMRQEIERLRRSDSQRDRPVRGVFDSGGDDIDGDIPMGMGDFNN